MSRLKPAPRGLVFFASLAALVSTVFFVTRAASAGAAQAAEPKEDIYASEKAWLCRPGRRDLCDGNEGSTVVGKDGTLLAEPWQPAADPPIDCFYVYPTVSEDPRANSTLEPGPGERRAIHYQFARFASVCRPFAPMYRQMTLAGLLSSMLGGALKPDPDLAYGDVLAAWKHYLRYDNHGRGVVLIGHSQGSRVLIRLIQNEIDGQPEEARLVSALLLGVSVEVPKGAAVGGSFQHIPLCTAAGETGCVITYMSFRQATPPPPDSRFAHASKAGMESGCTDPGLLSAEPIRSVIATHADLLGTAETRAEWENMADIIDTPFVTLDGLLHTHCVHDEHGTYLAVAVQPESGDLRPHDIPGDVVFRGHVLASWGLHLVDVNLAMGNLIDIVRRQSVSYLAHNPGKHR